MLSVEETQALIFSKLATLPAESVPLADAAGRVLAADACADSNSPSFDHSAMDGFAVRADDTSECFQIVGEVQAGSATPVSIASGQCVKIFTGAKLPADAGRVIMQEDATVHDEQMTFLGAVQTSNHIRKQGENCRRGDVLVSAGTQLGPLELAILANCGITRPSVIRRARVAHLVSGNELVSPDQTPGDGQIRDCNSILIQSLLARGGAKLVAQCHVPDDPVAAHAAFETLPEFDVLLISGGASVGAYDFARPLLVQEGFEIHLQKVNVRPGKPLVFASRGLQFAFALPGNPVSHWVVMQRFVLPMLARLAGGNGMLTQLSGRLAEGHEFRPDARPTFWPCRVVVVNGEYEVIPLRFVSSGDIVNMSGANGLLVLAPRENKVGRDTQVQFILCS